MSCSEARLAAKRQSTTTRCSPLGAVPTAMTVAAPPSTEAAREVTSALPCAWLVADAVVGGWAAAARSSERRKRRATAMWAAADLMVRGIVCFFPEFLR
jgi:hypothetical protein